MMTEYKGVWYDPDIINASGLVYRTQYLVLSRTMMEAMPYDWQERFTKLIEEVGEEFDLMNDKWITPKYQVKATDENGKFIQDPWGKYRYPNTEYVEQLRRNPEKTNQRNLDFVKQTASEPRPQDNNKRGQDR